MKAPSRRLLGAGVVAAVLIAVALGVLLVRGESSDASPTCTKSWTSAVSGSWTDGTKWTPAGAPVAADDVCILATGTYTVTLAADRTATSVQVGSTGAGLATLTIAGDSCATVGRLDVSTTAEVFAQGKIALTTTGACAGGSTTLQAGGGTTNAGTIQVATATSGAAAAIGGDLTNTGVVDIDSPTTYGGSGEVFDNQGTVQVTAALTVPSDFRNTSGSIEAAGAGTITLTPGNTFIQDQGGGDGNPIVLDSANVTFVPGASGTTYFAAHGTSVLGGDVPAGATITVEASGCAPALDATLTTSDLDGDQQTINAGTIRLSSAVPSPPPTCDFGSTSLITPYLIDNTGTIEIASGTGTSGRQISANIVNDSTGTFQVDYAVDFVNNPDPFYAPTIFSNSGSVVLNSVMAVYQNTFNHNEGTIDSPAGYLYVNDATFSQLYGVTTGSNPVHIVNGSTLEFVAPGAPGTQNFLIRDSATIDGTVPATATINIDADSCAVGTTVTTPGSFTNSGTIVLTSTATGCTAPGPKAKLAVGGFFANAGTLTSANGFGGTREVSTNALQNSGLLRLQAEAPLTVTGSLVFEASGTVIPTITSTANGSAAVSGVVTLGGTLQPEIAFTPAYGSRYDLFTYGDLVNRYQFDTVIDGGVDYVQESGFTSFRLSVLMPSETTLTVSPPGPTVYGQPVTLSSSVTVLPPNTSTLTGLVEFRAGNTSLGFVPVDGSGVAQLVTTQIPADLAGTIDAYYTGDTFVASSVAPTVSHVVNLATTTTALASSPNPSEVGEAVTFTATISVDAPGSGNPDGIVAFFDADTNALLGASVPVAGVAQTTIDSLPAGVAHVRADYSGSANFAGSDSAAVIQEVTAQATTVVASSTPNPSVFGQPVAFTATVTVDATGDPATGQVQFVDTATSTILSTATLGAGGVAHLSTATLPVGSHPVEARYLGDPLLAPSVATATQVVNKASTTVSVIKLPNPAVASQTVTINATVSPVAPSGLAPTGTVTFYDGATVLGTRTLDGSAVATYASNTFSTGSHTIIATYNGSSDFLTSTQNAGVLAVFATNSATGLTVTPSAPVRGQPVVMTATVVATPPASGLPTGNVLFSDGATTLGTVALDGAGQAQFTTSSLSVGAHGLSATYLGDANLGISESPTVTRTVAKAATTTVLTSSGTSVFGQPIDLTATVAVVAPGAAVPTGTVTITDGATTVGSGSLVGGVAHVSTSSLPVGTRGLVATFSGDGQTATSASAVFPQTIQRAGSATAMSSTPNPSTAGELVTFTATVTPVAPGAGTPTGTVTFFEGATSLGSVSVSPTGVAELATDSLAEGAHTVTSHYTGDGQFEASDSAPVLQQVGGAPTSVVITSDHNPSVTGQPVTFTATVTEDSTGLPVTAGDVSFEDHGTVLDLVPLDAGGQAAFTTASLAPNTYDIDARYVPGTGFAGGLTSVQQVVERASTTVGTGLAPSIAVTGETVTISSQVFISAPGAATDPITGTMTFRAGASVLGSAPVDATGYASFDTANVPVGTQAITVEYSGDGNYAGSTSPIQSAVVNQASTSAALVSSGSPSPLDGPVTFTATVTVVAPGGGIPTGQVTFSDGATVLGTGTVSAAGVAELTTSSLAVGTHTIEAVYAGDASYTASTSNSVIQEIGLKPTSTSLTSSPNPSLALEPVTFTATVTPDAPGTGTPTGTVTFTYGPYTLGTIALDGSGQASVPISSLPVGTRAVFATYDGDGEFAGSTSPPHSQVVDPRPTATSLATTPNPAVSAELVTLTATVTTSGLTIGAGDVAFTADGDFLGSASVSAGVAEIQTTGLKAGSHAIVATYTGVFGLGDSTSSTVTQVVTKAATSTALISSPNPSVPAQAVALTATVTVDLPGHGLASGQVTFREGATVLGTSAVDASGVAQFSTTALPVGSHTVTATYDGDAELLASTSPAVVQVVAAGSSSTSLAASPNPSVSGQSVTLTATVEPVAPATGVPTGTVTFAEGATVLGTRPVTGSGTATLTTSSLAVGTHPITATYGGSADLAGSASAPLDQVVVPAPTATSLSSDLNPSLPTQAVTLTATVTIPAPGAGSLGGTVTFTEGATGLGTAPVDAAGAASLTTSSLAVGTHPVVATFSGSAELGGSASVPLDQLVGVAPTTTTLSSTPNPSAPAQAVVFTATVAPISPVPLVATGQVTFLEGANVLGTGTVDPSGVAQFSTTLLSVGTHTISAHYPGDADLGGSTSNAVSQVVVVPDLPTTTLVTADPTTLVATQPFDLAVQVATDPVGGLVTGSVALRDGARLLGTVTLDAAGRAVLGMPGGLGAGTHRITAAFLGDTGLLPSTSTEVVLTVAKAQGTFTTTAAIDPTKPGTVTFLVTTQVKPPATTAPSGSIELRQGDTVVGTGRLVDGRAEIVQCFTPVCAPPPPTTTTTTAPTTTTSSPPTTTTESPTTTTTDSSTTSTTESSTTTTTESPRTTTTEQAGTTTSPPTTVVGTVVPTIAGMTTNTAVPAVAVPQLRVLGTRAASTTEVVASYPGDDDFDAYASDPIPVTIDGDSVSIPGDDPPPPVPPTTTPAPPTTTPGPSTTDPGTSGTTAPGRGITGEPTGGGGGGGGGETDATAEPDRTEDGAAGTVTGASDDGTDEDAAGAQPDRTGSSSAGPARLGSTSGAPSGSGSGSSAGTNRRPQSLSSQFGRSTISSSTANPTQISTDPKFVLENVLLTMFLLLFSVYPAYMINNTLAENYDEVLGWFGPVNRKFKRLQERRGNFSGPVVLGLSGLWAAVLYSFLDPNIGLNMPSFALFAGLFVSTVAITGVYDVARKRYLHHHYGIMSSLRGYPVGVIIGVILVVFSRAAHFTPGYLFGVFTALGFATQIDRKHDGKGVAAAALWLLGAATLSWFLWIPVADAASEPDAGFIWLFLDTTLASIWVIGIQAVVFGLMPLRFLDGEKVLYWNKAAWAAIYALGMFAFVHSMVRPGAEVDGDTYASALLLFVGFTTCALVFWAYFRFRTEVPGELERATDRPEDEDLVDA